MDVASLRLFNNRKNALNIQSLLVSKNITINFFFAPDAQN